MERFPALAGVCHAVTIVRRQKNLWMLLVLAAVLGAYANSFQNGFHFDDFHTITDNPAVRSLRSVPRFFTDATTFSVLPANRTYRPTVSTSLAIDYALGHGYAPFWFHLSTMVEFLLLIALVGRMAETMYGRVLADDDAAAGAAWAPAVVAAAWFGLHPAMAETVNYIIQRGDLFCTLGCVAALVVYAEKPKLRRTGLYLLPLVFALLSKPPAAVFPVLLGAWVWFFDTPGDRGFGGNALRWKRAAVAAVPSLLVTVAALVLESAMTPKTFAPGILSAAEYRLVQPLVWMRYAGELFLPLHLNVDSDLTGAAAVTPAIAAGMLFVALLGAGIFVCARRRVLYPVAFGLVWFVVTQLPTSAYALSEVENDHRMFFSFAGLIPAVVWAGWVGVQSLPGWKRTQRVRMGVATLVVVLLAGCAYGTRRRNAVWHTEESLWWDDVQKSPHNGRGLMIYGLTQMNQGRYERALEYFNRALAFTPNYATLEINLGVVHGAMGQPGAAEEHFQRAIALAPGDDQTHAFYARWLLGQGRSMEAAQQVALARTLNPARTLDLGSAAGTVAAPASAAINASLAAYERGDYKGAIAAARQALAVDPHAAAAYNNLGASFAALGQWNEAAENDRKAVALDPTLQIARNNLAEAMAHLQGTTAAQEPTKPDVAELPAAKLAALLNQSLALYQAGRFAESVKAARAALAIDPTSATAWNNVAAGEASQQHWDAAIAAAEKAVALKPDFQLARNNLAWAVGEKEKARAAK